MPKRLPRTDLFVIGLFGLAFQQQVDIYLNLEYDLYGFFEKGVDWLSIIPILGLFPSGALIFVNFYPLNNRKRAILYILLWTVFLTSFEYLSLQSGYFYFNGWKLWWSFLEYPILLLINISFYAFYIKITHK